MKGGVGVSSGRREGGVLFIGNVRVKVSGWGYRGVWGIVWG